MKLFSRIGAAIATAVVLAGQVGGAQAQSASAKSTVRSLSPGRQGSSMYADALGAIGSKILGNAQRVLGDPGAQQIAQAPAQTPQALREAYVPNQVVVVYRNNAAPVADVIAAPGGAVAASAHAAAGKSAAPAFSADPATQHALLAVGVTRSERLFHNIDRSVLAGLAAQPAGVNFANAYRLQLDGSKSVPTAVAALAKQPQVAYVSPAWRVSAMHAPPKPLASMKIEAAAGPSTAAKPAAVTAAADAGLPTNYAVSASAQSFLNAPGIDAVAAYHEIWDRFKQLPGEGEIITNVSLGDINDGTDPSCSSASQTVVSIDGQHYIDWQAMPLIPAYVADASGHLSGSASVCGVDPNLLEVGLDFSVMAPLPDDRQRPNRQPRDVNALFDLLGIAPGAQYRLVVPGNPAATYADMQAALLAAALQTPRPNVITASLGYGFDGFGFPGRYLEDDPMTQALVASIVHNFGIVVVISSNDGTRTYTNASIGPAGGSIATNVVTASLNVSDTGTQFQATAPTDLSDLMLSTAPSAVFDSGAIAVGGTTTNDIFAVPPSFAPTPSAKAQHAYASTRWTGAMNYSSGYGSRINLSAPGDNILAMSAAGTGYLSLGLEGGTSASAPEVAAVAAVVQQVARLTGQPFKDPFALRDFLVKTGTPVAAVPQADLLPMGPQVNLKNAVESLLGGGKPAVPRIAVAQRRNVGGISEQNFLSGTDPAQIDLIGPAQSSFFGVNSDTALAGTNAYAWITLAPDWEFMPAGTTYSLTAAGNARVLASTPWARLQPQEILAAGGFPLAGDQPRTVTLQYLAQLPDGSKVQKSFPLTFGPTDAKRIMAPAPKVPAVVDGPTITVTYDLTSVRQSDTPITLAGVPADLFSETIKYSHPMLVVSEPGRVNPSTGLFFHLDKPLYSVALTDLQGTVEVPVSALQGAGVYGIGIQTGFDDIKTVVDSESADAGQWYEIPFPFYGGFAYTRVLPPSGAVSLPAPLLASAGSTPGHYLQLPLHAATPVQVTYDVTRLGRQADGAMLEVSAPGPTPFGSYNLFNNPEGSIRDNNGIDSGSVAFLPLTGVYGTATFTPEQLQLLPGMYQNVRILPTLHGVPIGGASDISTIAEGSINVSNGGQIFNVGVDPQGQAGYLTATGGTVPGQPVRAIYTFDPTTDALTGGPFNTSAIDLTGIYYAPSNNLFANGSALIDNGSDISTLNLFDVASGAFTAFAPPADIAGGNVINVAASRVDSSAVMEGIDGTNRLYFRNVDIAAKSFGDPIYLDSLAPGVTIDNVLAGPAFNSQSKIALFSVFGGAPVAAPEVGPLTHATLLTYDTVSGKAGSFSNPGLGMAWGMAVDSTTNKAAVLAYDASLSIIDLATGQGTKYPLAGSSSEFIGSGVVDGLGTQLAVDEVNHLFLVLQGEYDNGDDNNQIARVLVYDESGNLLNAIPVSQGEGTLKISPSQRKGYVLTSVTSLVPFNY